ncbi:hypothetical protein F4779DRAFT_610163 [Xylariaceae sp. FL0662B]|nr:hypothetical protein F4779DRAFT_610163 [Xylariaceae sp. FL0662B]
MSSSQIGPLVLQSFEDPVQQPKALGWQRMGPPTNRTPTLLLISHWIWSSPSYGTFFLTVLKLIVAWPLVFLALHLDVLQFCQYYVPQLYPAVSWSYLNGNNSNLHHAQAASVPVAEGEGDVTSSSSPLYTDNVQLASNLPHVRTHQNKRGAQYSQSGRLSSDISSHPAFLCFIVDEDQGTYRTRKVSEYIDEHDDEVDTEFIFVSYTRLQFSVLTDAEINNYDYPDERTKEATRHISREDRKTLAEWGIDAARAAGKKAFWLDFECVRDSDDVARSTSSSEDVYRICDFVRVAHSMIIAVGPPVSSKVDSLLSGVAQQTYGSQHVTEWLRQWGSRLWTLPELLLSPNEYRIKLYNSASPGEPKMLAKRNFAERAWDDANAVKELVNHYEGSAILTQLQLIESALECFSRRQTNPFSAGDIAYAVRGLLPEKQRPKIDHSDSGFLAFARLLLANDSGKFLERLLCVSPPKADVPWYDITDRWRAKIREITPACEVTGIMSPDTILVDGAYGASIEWDRLDPIPIKLRMPSATVMPFFGAQPPVWQHAAVETQSRWKNTLLFFFIVAITIPLIAKVDLWCTTFVSLLGFGRLNNMGILTMVIALEGAAAIAALYISWVVFCLRSKDVSLDDARFIGVEGHVNVQTVERYLLCFSAGVFTEVQAIEDYTDLEDESEIGKQHMTQNGFIFTLIDTATATISRFRARKPPVAIFICGQHGGMHRALLCSYDAFNNKFIRETVLRIDSQVTEKMGRVSKFRLSLNTPVSDENRSSNEHDEEDQQVDDSEGSDTGHDSEGLEAIDSEGVLRDTWKVDLALIPLMFVLFASCNYYTLNSYARLLDFTTYWTAFLATQISACFFLPREQLQHVLPLVVVMKGLALAVSASFPMPVSYNAVITAVGGIADSIITLAFAILTLAWYKPSQVPIRLVIWKLGGPALFNTLLNRALFFYMPPIWCTLYFGLTTIGGLSGLGSPKQVRWLPVARQMEFGNLATLRSNSSAPTLRILWGRGKGSLYASLIWGILILIVSALDALRKTKTYDMLSNFTGVAAAIVMGFVLSKWPKYITPAMLMVLFPTILGVLLPGLGVVASALKRLGDIIEPLLWAFIGMNAGTWEEGLGMVCVSLEGSSVGNLLRPHILSKKSNILQMIPIVAELFFLLLLWGWAYWRKRLSRRSIALP